MFHSDVTSTSFGMQTIRKLQIRILPYILLLYIISYLDRINIGFAALTMNLELGITSQQFGLLVGFFVISYSLFEIPSNLILHRVGARVWIARILIVWGIVAALTGSVRTVHHLYIMRFLLGLGEAGFYPGILLYLTSWFRRREQAQAIAMFMTGVPMSNILGAPLFRPHSGPRALVWDEQLALAHGFGRPSGSHLWCTHVFFAAQSSGRSQIPY
jgi:ACS family tartrate transporter-like MFS transporter